MKTTHLTFLDILYPRSYPSNPMRAEATRTILQPEHDPFERAEASLPERNMGEHSSANLGSLRTSNSSIAA